ncbi:MAG: ribonuclease HIII [Acidaminococcaceae bacterium]
MSSFEDYLVGLREQLRQVGEVILQEKDLAYGRQIVIVHGNDKIVLAVYNGKKGRKLVWGGSESSFKTAVRQAIEGTSVPAKMTASLLLTTGGERLSLLEDCAGFRGIWAGSDESGKGDFFGPLVVAAVLVDTEVARQLQTSGVKDCKVLTDKDIMRLYPLIKQIAPLHVVLALLPEMYNYRYAQLKAEGKNLNHLLANGHIAVLSQVVAQKPECNYVLVDRFCHNNAIALRLNQQFPELNVVQEPRAEADIAVAAASVLARGRFLEAMNELSVLAGVTLPKGGGKQATACAQTLSATKGKEFLNKLVKRHFANYRTLN